MAAKKDVFPTGDTQYMAWLANATAFATANMTALKLVTAQVNELDTLNTDLTAAYAAHVTAQANARQKTADKDLAKRASAAFVREIVKKILNDQTIPDSLKEGMGLRPHDTSRSPVPAPTVAPGVLVEQDGSRQHTVVLFDPADRTRRAKPENVSQWQVFVAVGPTAPASVDACALAATVSRDRAAVTFAAADAGKTAWYIGRGVNAKGQPGPASTPVAATIAA